MRLVEGELYHIYNRGINKEDIFSSHDNYIYFLQKVRKYLLPVSDILCYCLMPNHFHFLICANTKSVFATKAGGIEMQSFSAALKQSLSSYTKAYNKMYGRAGSLFAQNTHCKKIFIDVNNIEGAFLCFNYIHQNPWIAGLVSKIEDWQYSSFKDYINLRKGTLCNKQKAFELLGLKTEQIYKDTYQVLSNEKLKKLML